MQGSVTTERRRSSPSQSPGTLRRLPQAGAELAASFAKRLGRRSSEPKAPSFGLPKDSVFPATYTRADLKPKGVDRLVIHPDNRVTDPRATVLARELVLPSPPHHARRPLALQIKGVYEIFIIFCVLYTAIIEPVKARTTAGFPSVAITPVARQRS